MPWPTATAQPRPRRRRCGMAEATLRSRRAAAAQPLARLARTGARGWGALAALVLLVLFNLAVTPNFLTWQTLNVNLTQVCTIVIVGTGMTLVIATGGI